MEERRPRRQENPGRLLLPQGHDARLHQAGLHLPRRAGEARRARTSKSIGVSGDTVESHQKFKKAEKLNFTLLADPEGKIAKAFGVTS